MSTDSKGKYKVIVMSDSSFFDRQGFVHTWLKFEYTSPTGVLQESYFSFGTPTYTGMVLSTFGFKATGDFDHDDMRGRIPTMAKDFEVTKEEFEKMKSEIKYMEEVLKPAYTLVPSKLSPGRYNCTTAAIQVLQAAGIHEFDGIESPNGMTAQIKNGNGQSNLIERFADMMAGALNKVADVIGAIFPNKKKSTTQLAYANSGELAAADTSTEADSGMVNNDGTEQPTKFATDSVFDTSSGTVYLPSDITPDAVKLSREGESLIVNSSEGDDPIVVPAFVSTTAHSAEIKQIQFANGTTWLPQDIVNHFEHDITLPVSGVSSIAATLQAMNQGISQFMALGEQDEAEVITDVQPLASSAYSVASWSKNCY